MATMPTIDFGSTRLAIPGNTITPNLDNGSARLAREGGAAMTRAADAVARGLYNLAEMKDRADQRDAVYAMHQAQNWFDGRWNGTDAVGADGRTVHTPGIGDRTWRDMEADHTDPVQELATLKRDFRETDIYKNLGGGARAHFDRQFALYEGRLDNAAAEQTLKLRARKIADQTASNLAYIGENVAKNYGADFNTFNNAAEWGATQATVQNLGSLVVNTDEITANGSARLKDIVFRGGKTYDQLDANEKAYVDRIYRAALKSYNLERINALNNAASNGMGMGSFKDADACLKESADVTNAMKATGIVNDAEVSALKANAQKAYQGAQAHIKVAQQRNAAAESKWFDENCLAGAEDTNVLITKKFDKVAYAQKIGAMVAAKQIDETSATALRKQYDQLADHQEYVRKALDAYNKTGKGGVWTTAYDRNGKQVQVFQPDRLGNGKTETDPTFAAKYTLADRNGRTPYFDNPARGMEELEYDLQMGHVSVPFYNAQMGKLRVLSDAKAKTAYVKIFGAGNVSIFSDRDVVELQKQGLDTSAQTVFAKNRWWAGNHDNGSAKNVPWLEDAQHVDGGEYKVTPEQEAQVYNLILGLTAQGVDPTDAIRAYIAPTFQGWINTDLENRLDPTFKVNGKTFAECILGSRRYGGNAPDQREARLAERKKAAYGSDNK